jgi:predicted helicase
MTFSYRLFISTLNNWSAEAENLIKGQLLEVQRLNLSEFMEGPVNWS